MAEGKVSRRRSWGKTRQRESITIINRMEIEDTLQEIASETKKAADRPQKLSHSAPNNLYHPELMTNDSLVEALRNIKVPIPIYPDGTPSRERLIYLYRTNITPRPQRKGQGRRKRKWQKSSSTTSWSRCEDWEDGDEQSMEVDVPALDGTAGGSSGGTKGSGGNWVTASPFSKKRKLNAESQGQEDDVTSPPSSKRLSLDAPSTPFAKITINPLANSSAHANISTSINTISSSSCNSPSQLLSKPHNQTIAFGKDQADKQSVPKVLRLRRPVGRVAACNVGDSPVSASKVISPAQNLTLGTTVTSKVILKKASTTEYVKSKVSCPQTVDKSGKLEKITWP